MLVLLQLRLLLVLRHRVPSSAPVCTESQGRCQLWGHAVCEPTGTPLPSTVSSKSPMETTPLKIPKLESVHLFMPFHPKSVFPGLLGDVEQGHADTPLQPAGLPVRAKGRKCHQKRLLPASGAPGVPAAACRRGGGPSTPCLLLRYRGGLL